ncbi:STAS domain-containing protein [Micromonospora purpureochromogenes]|uniref:STAS domain-containing protein n=1 Tax=Micromonospora purpureochromogenes TaxID=47872 RepID=UPI0033C4B6CB
MSSDELWHWRTDVTEGRTLVSLSGEIDLSGIERLREVLRDPGSRTGVVEVDLARVTFIDSSVIGVLIKARSDAAAAGGCLRVVNPTGHVRRVLHVTGVLPLVTDEWRDGTGEDGR